MGHAHKSEKLSPWREKLHDIIFEADTPAGKRFDVVLLLLIVLSIIVVMLDSVQEFSDSYASELYILEWIFTGIFTCEYLARIITVRQPLKYIFSFYGLIDLFSIIPTYLTLFSLQTQSMMVIRTLRLLRIFRVLKLTRYVRESHTLITALKASRIKITIFIGSVFSLAIIIGTMMYLIEGQNPNTGFTSIPRAIYWSIVTLTTVGYGDIAPESTLGQFFATIVMVLGYGIIAVPTGIISVELSDANKRKVSTQVCPSCTKEGHDPDALFCKFCGEDIENVI